MSLLLYAACCAVLGYGAAAGRGACAGACGGACSHVLAWLPPAASVLLRSSFTLSPLG